MQPMMIWFVGLAVMLAAWGISDAIQEVAKEMRRTNDRLEGKQPADVTPGQSEKTE